MRYAFMSFSAPGLSFGGLIELARRYGYDGIEPRIGAQHAHGLEVETSPAERRALREQAEQAGIAICCLATGYAFADPRAAPAMVDATRSALALAADVGAPRLRVFGGAVPADVGRAHARDSLIASLAALAEEAGQHGVTICLETHDDWTDPALVAGVMQAVNHPAIAVNWDFQHTTRQAGATIDAAFATLRPWVRHVHFHDGENRRDRLVFLPIGAGQYDIRRVVEVLLDAGYDGFLSGEWIDWEPYEQHLPRELDAMRQIERAVRAARGA